MDDIQKVLINSGRKDLAQEYYNKIAKTLSKSEISNIKRKLNNFSKNLKDLKLFVEKYKTTSFDDYGTDTLFDSSTVVHIKNIIDRIENAKVFN